MFSHTYGWWFFFFILTFFYRIIITKCIMFYTHILFKVFLTFLCRYNKHNSKPIVRPWSFFKTFPLSYLHLLKPKTKWQRWSALFWLKYTSIDFYICIVWLFPTDIVLGDYKTYLKTDNSIEFKLLFCKF